MKLALIGLVILSQAFAQEARNIPSSSDMAANVGNLSLNLAQIAIIEKWEKSNDFESDLKKINKGKTFQHFYGFPDTTNEQVEFEGASVQVGMSVGIEYTHIRMKKLALQAGDTTYIKDIVKYEGNTKITEKEINSRSVSSPNEMTLDRVGDCDYSFSIRGDHIENLSIRIGDTVVDAGGHIQKCVDIVKNKVEATLIELSKFRKVKIKKKEEILKEEIQEVTEDLEYFEDLNLNTEEVEELKGRKAKKKTEVSNSRRGTGSFSHYESSSSSSSSTGSIFGRNR